ncbi:MAG: hypothetical protein IPO27_18685 [Bacteroidetes bacterium]|nr:hypothetical protein [Bacteroidota bacterium]
MLQLAVIEREITYSTAPGSNGEKVFHDVLRAQFPLNNNYTRQIITLPAAGAYSSFNFTYTLNNAWEASQIEEIAHVEKSSTLEILNSGSSFDCPINTVITAAKKQYVRVKLLFCKPIQAMEIHKCVK